MTNANKNNTTAPFEVGDIICGIKNNGYNVANEHMTRAEVVAIQKIINNDDINDFMIIKIIDHKKVSEISKMYSVTNCDKRFKLVKPNQNKSIHITTDGVTTTAVLKNGNTVIEQSLAKCHKDDKFDFNIGSQIAFNRLMDKDKPLKLMYKDEIFGAIGEPIDKTDSFGNKLHVGDIVTNVVFALRENGGFPFNVRAKAICINNDNFGIISKCTFSTFDTDGIIALLEPYTSLLEKGRGYKISNELEIV